VTGWPIGWVELCASKPPLTKTQIFADGSDAESALPSASGQERPVEVAIPFE
jgi:hypothetical protein